MITSATYGAEEQKNIDKYKEKATALFERLQNLQ